MKDRIRVSPEISAQFPGFRACVIVARGVRNSASTAASREFLRAGAARGLASLAGRPPREHASIQNWREAYSSFGAKPSAYPCSAEALIQRAIKGGTDSLPSINVLVDLYNAVSLAHFLPIGGEDLGKIVGICELRFATQADGEAEKEDAAQAPGVGEVIWSDGVGWTCRRWNWRQGLRTRLTEHTRDAYFLIEGMASRSFEPDVEGAARELAERVQLLCAPLTLETFSLVGHGLDARHARS